MMVEDVCSRSSCGGDVAVSGGGRFWGKGMRLRTEASDSCDGGAIVNEDSKTVPVILRFLLLLFVVLCMYHGIELGGDLVNLSHMFYADDAVFEMYDLSNNGIDLLKYLRIKLGNGENTAFWEDKWCPGGTLKDRYPRVYALESCKRITVGAKLNQPNLSFSFRRNPRGGCEQEQFEKVKELMKETASHLFFSCCKARKVAKLITRWWNVFDEEFDSYDDWVAWLMSIHLPMKNKKMLEGVFYVMWWLLWLFRNKIIFEDKAPKKEIFFDDGKIKMVRISLPHGMVVCCIRFQLEVAKRAGGHGYVSDFGVINYFRMEVAELRMLRWTCGKIMLDMIPNGVYRAELEVETIINKTREGRLRWFRYVRRRPQSAPVRRVEALVVDGERRRGRPKLRWEDRVKHDLKELLLSEDMTSDRNEWRARISLGG
nr:hydroxycinnamoyl-CoA quinate/shikimate transferase [Tanacetum cinerariifolium]